MWVFIKNLFMFVLAVGAGVLGAHTLIQKQPAQVHEVVGMEPRVVDVLEVKRQLYTPRVFAYGNVEPEITLQSKAEVSGKISYVHPQLKKGGSIPKGTVVVMIDPEDYQTTLKQTQADLSASQSQLAQLRQEEVNTRQALDIARKNLRVAQQNLNTVKRKNSPIQKNTALIRRNINLAKQNYNLTKRNLDLGKRDLLLAQKEYKRLQGLGNQGLIPKNQVEQQQQVVLQRRQNVVQLEQTVVQQQQSIVSQEQQLAQQDQSTVQQDESILQQEQQVLQQQQNVSDLEGQLRTYSSRRANAEAAILRSQQQVKGEQTTLRRTEVRMPFDARISSVEVDVGGFAAVGGNLFEAIDTRRVEIEAELPIRQLQHLSASSKGRALDLSAANAQAALDELNLEVQVKLVGGNPEAVWKANVVRFAEAVDPVKRTLGLIVSVDNPYDNTVVGERPPLLQGMYVQVVINAPPFETLVIPRTAVHEGRVYIVDEENRLSIRTLDIHLQEGNDVVVRSGLADGELLVLNDLVPVIPRMPLQPKRNLPADPAKDIPAGTPENAASGTLGQSS